MDNSNETIIQVQNTNQEPPKEEPPKEDPPKQDPPKQELPKQELPKQEPQKLKKLTFLDAYEMINKMSNNKTSKSSTALDILAIYMKGQKTLYTEAKTYCEQKLNSLMLPAIFISSLCVVLGSSLDNILWGKTLVASLNGFNVFLLAIISYLKLDAKAEAHKTSAYKYDKLQSHCEFLSGRILFYSDTSNNISDQDIENENKELARKAKEIKEQTKKEEAKLMINDIEAKVTEVKESNQFILPEFIRYTYPKLYSTNVFAEVKKLQNDELVLVNDFKELINESITYKNMIQNNDTFEKICNIEKRINRKLNEIILHKNKFLDLDDMFCTEMKKASDKNNRAFCRTRFFNT